MDSHDQFGGLPAENHSLSSGFDVFEIPDVSNEIIGSRDIEVRLFTTLDRQV